MTKRERIEINKLARQVELHATSSPSRPASSSAGTVRGALPASLLPTASQLDETPVQASRAKLEEDSGSSSDTVPGLPWSGRGSLDDGASGTQLDPGTQAPAEDVVDIPAGGPGAGVVAWGPLASPAGGPQAYSPDDVVNYIGLRISSSVEKQLGPLARAAGNLATGQHGLLQAQISLNQKLDEMAATCDAKAQALEAALNDINLAQQIQNSKFQGDVKQRDEQVAQMSASIGTLNSRIADLQAKIDAKLSTPAPTPSASGEDHPDYAYAAYVGGWPAHTPKATMMETVNAMIQHTKVEDHLNDIFSKPFGKGVTVKFTGPSAMWTFINQSPYSLKSYTAELGEKFGRFVNKSNGKATLRRRVNTREVAKCIARRFGCEQTKVYADVATHTVYLNDKPILEVIDKIPSIFEKNINRIWEGLHGSTSMPPCEQELYHIAYSAGLLEAMPAATRTAAAPSDLPEPGDIHMEPKIEGSAADDQFQRDLAVALAKSCGRDEGGAGGSGSAS